MKGYRGVDVLDEKIIFIYHKFLIIDMIYEITIQISL